MAELYDEEGNAVDALTPEEAEAKIAEATEAAKQSASEDFRAQLEAKEAELEEAKKKEQNFSALRNKTKTQEELAADARAEVEALKKDIAEARDSGKNYAINNAKERAIKQMADGDVELEKKLRTNYEVIQRPTDTEDQVLARVRDAYLLSADAVQSTGGNFAPGTTTRRVGNNPNAPQVSSELKSFGAEKFGLTDDDFKNYAK